MSQAVLVRAEERGSGSEFKQNQIVKNGIVTSDSELDESVSVEDFLRSHPKSTFSGIIDYNHRFVPQIRKDSLVERFGDIELIGNQYVKYPRKNSSILESNKEASGIIIHNVGKYNNEELDLKIEIKDYSVNNKEVYPMNPSVSMVIQDDGIHIYLTYMKAILSYSYVRAGTMDKVETSGFLNINDIDNGEEVKFYGAKIQQIFLSDKNTLMYKDLDFGGILIANAYYGNMDEEDRTSCFSFTYESTQEYFISYDSGEKGATHFLGNFNSYTVPSEGPPVLVRYVTDESLEEDLSEQQIITGLSGTPYKTTEKNIEGYTLKEVVGMSEGKIGDPKDSESTVFYIYFKNPIKSKITIKYIDEQGNSIHEAKHIEGNFGDLYNVSTFQYKLSISGYNIDESKLPKNANGTFNESEQLINYVYKKNTEESTVEGQNKSLISVDNVDESKNTNETFNESEQLFSISENQNNTSSSQNKYEEISFELKQDKHKKLPKTGTSRESYIKVVGLALFLLVTLFIFIKKYKFLNKNS
ncbi:MucBP domain-containing protein [Enterococcus faecalis]|uniref:MucBP domain-containing protein n=1 Tax=Enterococcus faecalis TaxID=1351 RepID=UPI001F1B4DD6|nr:MucBP domain-containing protein [Enterococcus faecalis]BDC77737.1 hypothetical protein EFK4_26400 [Enterococcus faecalis]